jgi:hypothetical protein
MAEFNPKISAGGVAVNNQEAKTNGAVVQNPPRTIIFDNRTFANVPGAERQQQVVSDLANARVAQAGIDTGLDAKTVTLVQSQRTPASNINNGAQNVAALVESGLSPQEALDIAQGGTPGVATQPGVGSRNEDAKTVTSNSTRDMINATFQANTNNRIYTQPNILDDYASYTYQISWYLLSQDQYNSLVNSSRRSVGAWSLLIQSGGIPLNSSLQNNADTTNNLAPPSRSQFFPVDYYLDDLEIHSLFPLGGTQMAHSAASIKFKVVEPNGLTLIDNLYLAVNSIYGGNAANGVNALGQNVTIKNANGSTTNPETGFTTAGQTGIAGPDRTPNYIQAHYCLTIKFYGYDINGNLQAPLKGKYTLNNTPNLVGVPYDVNAVVLKIYPFLLSDIKFSMVPGANSRGIEYQIEGVPTGQAAGFGQSRGTIPFNFQLSGTTVKDLLIGNAARSGLQSQQDGRVPKSTPPGEF